MRPRQNRALSTVRPRVQRRWQRAAESGRYTLCAGAQSDTLGVIGDSGATVHTASSRTNTSHLKFHQALWQLMLFIMSTAGELDLGNWRAGSRELDRMTDFLLVDLNLKVTRKVPWRFYGISRFSFYQLRMLGGPPKEVAFLVAVWLSTSVWLSITNGPLDNVQALKTFPVTLKGISIKPLSDRQTRLIN